MKQALSKAANQLLELEKKSAERRLTADEAQRWEELSFELFGLESMDRSHYSRRCFRIPALGNCGVILRGSVFECQVREISYVSFTLAGDCFAMAQEGETLFINFLSIDSKKVDLQLRCSVVRIRAFDQTAGIGAEISEMNSPLSLNQFLEKIYQPLYFGFLERQSKNTS